MGAGRHTVMYCTCVAVYIGGAMICIASLSKMGMPVPQTSAGELTGLPERFVKRSARPLRSIMMLR